MTIGMLNGHPLLRVMLSNNDPILQSEGDDFCDDDSESAMYDSPDGYRVKTVRYLTSSPEVRRDIDGVVVSYHGKDIVGAAARGQHRQSEESVSTVST